MSAQTRSHTVSGLPTKFTGEIKMETIEYRTQDKAEWGRGEWQNEPDKVQWRDEATGLPCLIVRNHGGAWCGYVGVPENHPYFEKDYDDVPVEVHGGLTFADFCSSHDESDFKRSQERMEQSRAEAAQYPVGDAARRLREWGPVMTDFSGWQKRCEATGICHVAAPGDPDRVWWLGFDCSHCGDASPAYDRKYSFGRDGTYKNIRYVQHETMKLAAQIKAAA